MQLITFSALATAFLAVFAAANPVELEKKEADPAYYREAEEYWRRPEYYRPVHYGPAPGAGIGIGANADAAADAHLGVGIGAGR
ncbi:uncharacterized protein LDX57_012475 [Aspergillus melleus]|uniref:uncharacterized protein n=1 Tax=Aspergillus melleus TaxID=138277 RepID=UPI001E8D0105|nr:uncharacterized protein LDX57_012475 [Aspergillus melleus]KAH8434844.1 hypothetical protein LDX57_012475 [Aspergillus melleus]